MALLEETQTVPLWTGQKIFGIGLLSVGCAPSHNLVFLIFFLCSLCPSSEFLIRKVYKRKSFTKTIKYIVAMSFIPTNLK